MSHMAAAPATKGYRFEPPCTLRRTSNERATKVASEAKSREAKTIIGSCTGPARA